MKDQMQTDAPITDTTQTGPAAAPALDTVDITPTGRRKDITRAKAQTIAAKLFGPRGFARRKAKTHPGRRRQVALRDTYRPTVVRVIGEGRTWLEAFREAAAKVDAEGLLP